MFCGRVVGGLCSHAKWLDNARRIFENKLCKYMGGGEAFTWVILSITRTLRTPCDKCFACERCYIHKILKSTWKMSIKGKYVIHSLNVFKHMNCTSVQNFFFLAILYSITKHNIKHSHWHSTTTHTVTTETAPCIAPHFPPHINSDRSIYSSMFYFLAAAIHVYTFRECVYACMRLTKGLKCGA